MISSQQVHERFGGVVPEIASRHHLELVNAGRRARARAGGRRRSTTSSSWPPRRDRGSSARCSSGSRRAKALAAARELPFAPVDHLQGHVAANFLVRGGDGRGAGAFEPPFVCLIASGGHTLLAQRARARRLRGARRTLDDAAGEAFDKGARMLGLGYPGRRRRWSGWPPDGDPDGVRLPRARPAERARGGRGARHRALRARGSTSPSPG